MSALAIAELESHFDRTLSTLEELTRIPGISAAAYPAAEVRRSAEAVADVLLQSGLSSATLLTAGDEHPAVYAEAIVSPEAPVVLVYGHHDVQPPGREEAWHSPPFEPHLRDGQRQGFPRRRLLRRRSERRKAMHAAVYLYDELSRVGS